MSSVKERYIDSYPPSGLELGTQLTQSKIIYNLQKVHHDWDSFEIELVISNVFWLLSNETSLTNHFY